MNATTKLFLLFIYDMKQSKTILGSIWKLITFSTFSGSVGFPFHFWFHPKIICSHWNWLKPACVIQITFSIAMNSLDIIEVGREWQNWIATHLEYGKRNQSKGIEYEWWQIFFLIRFNDSWLCSFPCLTQSLLGIQCSMFMPQGCYTMFERCKINAWYLRLHFRFSSFSILFR